MCCALVVRVVSLVVCVVVSHVVRVMSVELYSFPLSVRGLKEQVARLQYTQGPHSCTTLPSFAGPCISPQSCLLQSMVNVLEDSCRASP